MSTLNLNDLDSFKQYIGFTASKSFLGRVIRLGTHGDVSHTFMSYYSQDWGCWVEHGAVTRGFIPEPRPNGVVKDLRSIYCVGDLKPGMIANQRYLSAAYDFKALLGMTWVEFMWHRFKKQVKNPLNAKEQMICSEIMRRIIRDSGIPLVYNAINESATDPEMLEDAIQLGGYPNLVKA